MTNQMNFIHLFLTSIYQRHFFLIVKKSVCILFCSSKKDFFFFNPLPWDKNIADQLQLLVEFRLVMVDSYLDSLVLTVNLLFKSDNTRDL